MRITEIGESPIITLDRLKAYANIVDPTRDDELRNVLQSAAIRVAQYADRALLPCTIEDYSDGGEIQLWMPPVAEVVSVTDTITGETITGEVERIDNRLLVPEGHSVRVVYRVEPLDAEAQSLLSFVLQMAVAIWDGNTDEEAKVYRRIPADYVVH